MVKFCRKLIEAVLANAKIASTVIVYPVVADRCAHSANIADEIEIGDALEIEGVADGAAFLGAGRHSAADAVILAANSAIGPAQPRLFARDALRLHHLFIGA